MGVYTNTTAVPSSLGAAELVEQREEPQPVPRHWQRRSSADSWRRFEQLLVAFWVSDLTFTISRPLIIRLASPTAKICSGLVGLVFLLAACHLQRPTARAGIRHHPSLSAFDRGIGPSLHLESQLAGHWPSCQTSAGPPELALRSKDVRATGHWAASSGISMESEAPKSKHQHAACSSLEEYGARYRLMKRCCCSFPDFQCALPASNQNISIASPGTALHPASSAKP